MPPLLILGPLNSVSFCVCDDAGPSERSMGASPLDDGASAAAGVEPCAEELRLLCALAFALGGDVGRSGPSAECDIVAELEGGFGGTRGTFDLSERPINPPCAFVWFELECPTAPAAAGRACAVDMLVLGVHGLSHEPPGPEGPEKAPSMELAAGSPVVPHPRALVSKKKAEKRLSSKTEFEPCGGVRENEEFEVEFDGRRREFEGPTACKGLGCAVCCVKRPSLGPCGNVWPIRSP